MRYQAVTSSPTFLPVANGPSTGGEITATDAATHPYTSTINDHATPVAANGQYLIDKPTGNPTIVLASPDTYTLTDTLNPNIINRHVMIPRMSYPGYKLNMNAPFDPSQEPVYQFITPDPSSSVVSAWCGPD